MRVLLAVSLVIVSIAVVPSPAEACSCAGIASLPEAHERADLVFLGTVARFERFKSSRRENSDGSISGGTQTVPPIAVFNLGRVFRGRPSNQLTLVGDGTTCDVAFEPGQTWLVYAQISDGRVITSKCSRTRLRANADQDMDFLEGRALGRAQGVVSGEVLRRVAGSGELTAGAPFQSLTIIAAGAAGKIEVMVTRWGPYDLILPPGDFDIWIERDRRVVSGRTPVRVKAQSDERLLLVVESD